MHAPSRHSVPAVQASNKGAPDAVHTTRSVVERQPGVHGPPSPPVATLLEPPDAMADELPAALLPDATPLAELLAKALLEDRPLDTTPLDATPLDATPLEPAAEEPLLATTLLAPTLLDATAKELLLGALLLRTALLPGALLLAMATLLLPITLLLATELLARELLFPTLLAPCELDPAGTGRVQDCAKVGTTPSIKTWWPLPEAACPT